MKKLFVLLGANVALLVSLSAKGDFQTVAKITQPTKFILTKVTQTDGEDNAFLNVLNLQNITLKEVGNTETGAGYVWTAVYQNTQKKEKHFALLTITAKNWNNATVTAQLCDITGEVAGATAQASTQPVGNVNNNYAEALNNGVVIGNTNMNPDDLIANKNNGTLNAKLTGANNEDYGKVTLVNIKPASSNTFEAVSEDGAINYTLTAIAEEVTFEAALAVGQTQTS